jgi:glutathione-independent formaldehyde dehydrogenase
LHELPPDQAPEAYDRFDKREDDYTKILLRP